MKQYKVLAQSDSFWRDRFSPQQLEGALNDLAKDGWSVITIATTEFTGLGGLGSKRHEVFVVLEREKPEQPAAAARVVDGQAIDYDASLIPSDRFYKDVDQVSSSLKGAGIIDEAGLMIAREQMAARGGHLCDHLLALGLVDGARLREFFRDHYGIGE